MSKPYKPFMTIKDDRVGRKVAVTERHEEPFRAVDYGWLLIAVPLLFLWYGVTMEYDVPWYEGPVLVVGMLAAGPVMFIGGTIVLSVIALLLILLEKAWKGWRNHYNQKEAQR